MANVLPASLPDGAPLIEHFQYQALNVFSSAPGRCPVLRGYFTAGRGSASSSRRRYEAITPSVNPQNEVRSFGVSEMLDAMVAVRSSSVEGFLADDGVPPRCDGACCRCDGARCLDERFRSVFGCWCRAQTAR